MASARQISTIVGYTTYTVQNNHCEKVKGNCIQELFYKYVEYDYPGEHSPE